MTDEIRTLEWAEALPLLGDELRYDAPEPDDDPRSQVTARSYTVSRARRVLDLHSMTLNYAVQNDLFVVFVDPEGNRRIIADDIHQALEYTDFYEKIAQMERLPASDIAAAMRVSTKTARKRLRKAGLDHNKPYWYQIRGQWNLPATLFEFRERVSKDRNKKRQRQRMLEQRNRRRREEERQRRAELSAQLVASFPAWSELDRSKQMIQLHIGPPNSGKTHDSLKRLAELERGWYLAPLRLLAWEVFDRFNDQGIPCNLLTGEEQINVEGAQITAATIEMFNANQSGECVVIDEAQMLADSDRGWAWTRAMMQCRAPEMHVIAPPTARHLIQQMAEGANIPLDTIHHERLTPIRVADAAWSLKEMPPKTILVAFSRKMVLTLKTRLEKLNRDVSVVYGSLPPEVRRRQAERFASGETDICVATDAVGMGLNLPADYVCFYETEKFDGRNIRRLKPAEVQQIGGRAGRYGISQAGEVGATTRKDLNIVKSLFYGKPVTLTHARVAPSVGDLELIPGSLSERLREWSELESIPPELRGSVRTADMTERIELASMLTDEEVAGLGLEKAVQLVNAPTRKSTRDYWYECTQHIIRGLEMPLPPEAPDAILGKEDLDYAEMCISAADIYLWLGYRDEFHQYATRIEQTNDERREWSERIDAALLQKIHTNYIRKRW